MSREEILQLVEKEFGTGCAKICKERARQKEVKGYDLNRDRHLYEEEELAAAAVTYALPPDEGIDRELFWPWNQEFWRPEENRIREFEKSGALMAAQIDVSESIEEEKQQINN